MVRAIIKPDTPRINLSIPYEYIGEEVEVLVFPVKGENGINKTDNAKRIKSFNNFMKLKGTLPADFDCQNELSDYRDERYGHIN